MQVKTWVQDSFRIWWESLNICLIFLQCFKNISWIDSISWWFRIQKIQKDIQYSEQSFSHSYSPTTQFSTEATPVCCLFIFLLREILCACKIIYKYSMLFCTFFCLIYVFDFIHIIIQSYRFNLSSFILYCILCIYHNFFYWPSADGQSGCFKHLLI